MTSAQNLPKTAFSDLHFRCVYQYRRDKTPVKVDKPR